MSPTDPLAPHPDAPGFQAARIIVTMGVSASGKSKVGKAVARRLHVPFVEGDDYHTPENIEKMRSGTPLTDDDRWPWLDLLGQGLRQAADRKGAAVGSCSALKRAYRDTLRKAAGEPILFVHLHGDREVIAARMSARAHHYMPTSLLLSQFDALEMPGPDENVLTMPITDGIETIADRVVKALDHLKSFKRKQ